MSNEFDSSEIAVPAVTVEAIGKVARALYAINKPAGYKEIATMAGMAPQYTSQTLSALKDLNIAVPSSGRGFYVLTNEGEMFARLLGFGKEEESRKLFALLIKKKGPWSEIVSFLKMNRDTPREPLDLVLHAETRLGKRWTKSMRTRIAQSYKSILDYANLIEMEGGKIVSKIDMEDDDIPPDDTMYDSTEDSLHKPQAPLHTEMPTRQSAEYSEFSITDFFKVYVKRTPNAVAFLRKQLNNSSVMIDWLKALEETIQEEGVDE